MNKEINDILKIFNPRIPQMKTQDKNPKLLYHA